MHSLVIVLCLSVTLAGLASCQSHETSGSTGNSWPIADYIKRPKILQYDRESFDWIKEVAGEIDPSSPDDIIKFIEETRTNLLRHGKWIVKYKGRVIMVKDTVFNLFNIADTEYDLAEEALGYYIKLVEHVYGSLEVMVGSSPPDHDVALFNYLKQIGQMRFNNYNLMEEYKRQMEATRQDSVEAIDLLVESQDNNGKNKEKHNDQQLILLARKINLAGGQFDAKKMLKVAKKDLGKGWMKDDTLQSYIGMYCSGFLSRFEYLLDRFNVIRLLDRESNPEGKFPKKLIKFNEYGRLCHQLFDWSSHDEVVANIEKGLKSSLGKFVKCMVNCS